jgi:hypothetical protein
MKTVFIHYLPSRSGLRHGPCKILGSLNLPLRYCTVGFGGGCILYGIVSPVVVVSDVTERLT